MIEDVLIDATVAAIKSLYLQEIDPKIVSIQKTNIQYRNVADYTIMVFPLVRFSKKPPEKTASDIGKFIQHRIALIENFSVVKGFLNLRIKENYWVEFLTVNCKKVDFGQIPLLSDEAPWLIEFSSPNTNKPLHLGHIRNNLLGEALARILKANGRKVVKVNLVNDRGIHICKSMLAWQKWGLGETPENSGLKGDKLVGKYYVEFDIRNKQQIEELEANGMDREEAAKNTPLMIEAQQMLRKWEQGDEEVMTLWRQMNAWVYEGFEYTYANLGISFDKIYFESETYLLGKDVVQEGIEKGVFTKKPDNSVWVDLTEEGLDEKLLLRSDGTSVYITQDLGTACLRHHEFKPARMIYVVGNEQNYHFDVLKKVLIKSGFTWADTIMHFSYGMVELPEGKMKSREGTVVDADDLIQELTETARQTTMELGKIEDFESAEAEQLFRQIGMGGLKYFILKVDPARNMMFNPEESIDFNGNTGPFIQYTFARIRSLLRKSAMDINTIVFPASVTLHEAERELLILCHEYPATLKMAAEELSPALMANYLFELARQYNQFYQHIPVLKEENISLLHFRLALSHLTARIIKNGMELLGIEVPERM